MPFRFQLIVTISFLIIYACQPAQDSPNNEGQLACLKEEFKDPPASARPKGFYSWINGNFDLERITTELEESKANGMGGYDIWDVSPISDIENRVPAGPKLMGEESTNAIVHTIKEATRLDMEIGIVVASSWNSGGSWIKPEHGVMGILDTSVIVAGKQKVAIDFPFPELPKTTSNNKWGELILNIDANGKPEFYREVTVLAMPTQSPVDTSQIINISQHFKNGRLDWQAPEGEWKITRYIYTNLGTPLKRPSPNSRGLMIDHFSKEAQEAHLQHFIDKLQPQLGGDLGETALKYLYNDSYEIKGPVWSPGLLQEFKQRRGYDMTPFLPVLKGQIVQSQEISHRFMYDFHMTLSDLAIANHYKFGVEFCKQYGIGFHAEGGGPGPPLHDVPVESIKALGALSVPRGEFWHNYPKYDAEGFDSHWFVKGIASAAHLYDQTFVEAESFTSLTHWQESWQDLKPTADQAFCEGLNRVVFHTSTHSPNAFGSPGYVYGFGTHMNTRQTWWPKSRAWIDYLARNSYMLQLGNFVGDLLYYYGDQAPNFAKQRHIDSTLGFGYDYDVINTEKLLELEVRDGKMTLPHGQEYALLVLPEQEDMPLTVLEKIENMLQAGALVAGPKPEKTPGLYNYQENEQTLQSLANEMWSGLSADQAGFNEIGEGKLYWGAAQRDILFDNGVFPDFNFKGQDDSVSLNFIHRRLGNTDIYFVRNRQNREVTAECIFRVADKKPGLWLPETGEVKEDLIFKNEGDSTRVALSFAPYDAYFIVFAENGDTPFIEKVAKEKEAIFPVAGPYAQLQGYQVKTGQFTHSGGYYFNYSNGDKTYQFANKVNEIPIKGEWQLRFPDGWGAPESTTFAELKSWTESEEDGVKYFSGIAKYEIDFEIDSVIAEQRYFLDLGEVRELAEVWVNGESLGVIWHQPFQLEVGQFLQKGKNHLVVDVANEWNNRLVGDGFLPEGEKYTNTNIVNGPKAWGIPWENVPLQPAGLLGPVKIQIYQK